MNSSDFQALARLRISDAEALASTGRNWSGCYYMAGYAVECAIKACIAKQTLAEEWPPPFEKVKELYTHNLERLLKHKEFPNGDTLTSLLAVEKQKNTAFSGYWQTVKDWSEKSRYEKYTQQEATDLLNAITDPKNGVLRWLQQYW